MSVIRCYEGSTPAVPPSGVVNLYAKSDGRWYFMSSSGTEYPMKSVGAGSGDLLADGSIPLTSDWDVGSYSLTMKTITLDVADGIAPMTVTSTTLVANLNADQLDGNEATAFATAAQGALADTALQSTDIGSSVQAWSAVLDATTASFTTTDETKLDGIDPNASLKSNLTATAAPTVTDDSGSGYAVGSKWCDITNDIIYFCLDASVGAAIWQEVGSGTGGGGGMTVTTVKTGAYTASANEVVPVDSSAAPVTITLPALPSAQDRIIVSDVGHAAGTYNITIARNGKNIVGVAEDFVIDQDEGRWDGSYDGTDNWDSHIIGTPSLVNASDYVYKWRGVNNQTGTTYDFVRDDEGKLITGNNASAQTFTIPANSSVAYEIGTKMKVMQLGAGQITIALTTDTLRGNTKTSAQYASVRLTKIAATEWVVEDGTT